MKSVPLLVGAFLIVLGACPGCAPTDQNQEDPPTVQPDANYPDPPTQQGTTAEEGAEDELQPNEDSAAQEDEDGQALLDRAAEQDADIGALVDQIDEFLLRVPRWSPQLSGPLADLKRQQEDTEGETLLQATPPANIEDGRILAAEIDSFIQRVPRWQPRLEESRATIAAMMAAYEEVEQEGNDLLRRAGLAPQDEAPIGLLQAIQDFLERVPQWQPRLGPVVEELETLAERVRSEDAEGDRLRQAGRGATELAELDALIQEIRRFADEIPRWRDRLQPILDSLTQRRVVVDDEDQEGHRLQSRAEEMRSWQEGEGLRSEVTQFLDRVPRWRSRLESTQFEIEQRIEHLQDEEAERLRSQAQGLLGWQESRELLAAIDTFLESVPRWQPRLSAHREVVYRRALDEPPTVAGFTYLRDELFRCGGVENVMAIYRCEAFARALDLGGDETDVACEFTLVPAGGECGRLLVARTEVTQRVWAGTVDGTSLPSAPSHHDGERFPVERISWLDIQGWERHQGGLRLPTTSEWEHFVRGGSSALYCYGSDPEELGHYAWFNANSGTAIHAVAGKQPNAFGIYDVHGNAYEWMEDRYPSTERELREGRGGSYRFNAWTCSSYYEFWFEQDFRSLDLGFRPVCSVP